MVSYSSAKEEIKRTADIVELIGQFVHLRKRGRNYVGLCPFHTEKDPSFTVNQERQTFHCFGCKKGGDIFTFWMEYHSSTFPEALRDLAERYNVKISEGFNASAERKVQAQREVLFKINEVTASYFQETLRHQVKGNPGRTYINQRSITEEIISEFRLGYAPDEWDGLVKTLIRHHLGLDMAVQAGVVIPKKGGGYYDRFRGRIIFPIFDLRLHVVAFGGRALDNSMPKYVNTPETPIFHKGEFLYGLHASHKEIRENGRAVIVEGYMDYLALRKHGLKEVVATLGTAITAKHIRKLKGYANEAVVVFDSDEAGKAAALRSLPVFSNEGLSAKAIVLPDGHDPDSFVNAKGLSQFSDLLNRASSMFDFFLELKFTEGDSDLEKIHGLKEILPVLFEINNFTLRSLYVKRLSERIGIKEDVVLSELEKWRKNLSGDAFEKGFKERLTSSRVERRSLSDPHLLNLLIHYPRSVERLMNCEWKILLSDPVVMEIVDAFFEKYSHEGPFSPEDLLDNLESEVACRHFREALVEDSYYSDQEVEQALEEFEEKEHQIRRKASVQRACERGDVEGLNQLLKMKISRAAKVLRE